MHRWSLHEASGRLTYQVEGSKFCERVGRAHKSNHIMLVVELLPRVPIYTTRTSTRIHAHIRKRASERAKRTNVSAVINADDQTVLDTDQDLLTYILRLSLNALSAGGSWRVHA